jgi:hypothetical protein
MQRGARIGRASIGLRAELAEGKALIAAFHIFSSYVDSKARETAIDTPLYWYISCHPVG